MAQWLKVNTILTSNKINNARRIQSAQLAGNNTRDEFRQNKWQHLETGSYSTTIKADGKTTLNRTSMAITSEFSLFEAFVIIVTYITWKDIKTTSRKSWFISLAPSLIVL